jgi:hypothetical protein
MLQILSRFSRLLHGVFVRRAQPTRLPEITDEADMAQRVRLSGEW